MIGEIIRAMVGMVLSFDHEEVENEDGTKSKKRKAKLHHGRMVILVALWLCIFAAWAFGTFPGSSGFARASDLKQEVAAQVKPVAEKMDKMDAKVSDMQGSLNEMLAMSTAQSINAKKRAICKTTEPEERSRLNTDLNILLGKYQKFSGGISYTVPTCSEL